MVFLTKEEQGESEKLDKAIKEQENLLEQERIDGEERIKEAQLKLQGVRERIRKAEGR